MGQTSHVGQLWWYLPAFLCKVFWEQEERASTSRSPTAWKSCRKRPPSRLPHGVMAWPCSRAASPPPPPLPPPHWCHVGHGSVYMCCNLPRYRFRMVNFLPMLLGRILNTYLFLCLACTARTDTTKGITSNLAARRFLSNFTQMNLQ